MSFNHYYQSELTALRQLTAQAHECGLRLLLQRAVEGDQAAAKGGELAATAVAPAGGAQHQRLGR